MNALFFYYSKLLRTIRRHFFLVKIGAGKIRPTGKFNLESRGWEKPEMVFSMEKERVWIWKPEKGRIFRRQAGSLRYEDTIHLRRQ
jgi:hypothetical protein